MGQLNLFGEAVGLKEIKRTKSEVFNDYNSFVDKFETKKTTDDCYTPPAVYDAVLDFVRGIYDLEGVTVVRPFMPGGDYENFPYPDKCAVVDNPPFSLLAKIIRFYTAHDIPFFLFAPALTLFSSVGLVYQHVTPIICGAGSRYENGAVVPTSFVTNMTPDIGVWVCPQLLDAIKAAQCEPDKTKQKFAYPDNILTAATIQRLAHHGEELKINRRSCRYINDSDTAKAQGRSLFGGGYILSDKAAADKAAAERAAAERASATRLSISTRERRIIDKLNEQEHEQTDIS